ncbi:uncharacterized protein TNCV_1383511 [Trichonephila clavipes]|nr:uncharacterized protein TNCV_1383511 [Trichonephila clavipes]
MGLIKNCDRYKNDPDSVHDLANLFIEERKYEESQQLELEKIREKSKLDLEIARIRANYKDNISEVNCNDSFSLDSLIKSIRTLTVKIPDKPEEWSFFFLSLERAFAAKSVTDKFKPEILLNLLEEKVANIILYMKDEDLKNYDKIKSIILQEFEPTPQSCLENFMKATRQNCESHVQFASRLTTNWEYYLKLRDVSNFEVLKQLIFSDKIFSTLDKETASHISVRQADKWFDPLTLGKEIDLFYSSRGKPLSESINYCRKNQNSKNMSRVFFSDVKESSFVNLKFFANAAKKKEILLCVSLESQILRVKESFNLLHWGAERAGNRGILDESTFSEGVCVQTHKLHREDFERGDFFSGCRKSAYCNELRSSVVMSDMYIDDVLTGAETLLEAKELKNQLMNIFVKGGPVVAKAKIFLQKLWMLKIDWTDLLPDTINREWRQFVESLQVVNDININRCIVVEQPEVIELQDSPTRPSQHMELSSTANP